MHINANITIMMTNIIQNSNVILNETRWLYAITIQVDLACVLQAINSRTPIGKWLVRHQ